MNEYQAIYEDRFVRNLARYSNLRQRIQRRVEQILENPYVRTERLGRVSGGLDLRGGKYTVVVVVSEPAPSERHWIITAYIARKLAKGGEIEWERT